MRNWKPFLKDGDRRARRAGVTRIIGIPLAPQFSTLSVTKYFDAATAALPAGIDASIRSIRSSIIRCCSTRLPNACARAAPHADEEIVFTAHSLPRARHRGGRSATRTRSPARRAASPRACGLTRYRRAYQSAGRTPEPWIGLDVERPHPRTARRDGARRFLVVPVGFVCDHTEILFDIDVQAQATAAGAGRVAPAHRVAEHARRRSSPPSNRSSAKSYDRRVDPMSPVVIVGGGMAGLATAYELQSPARAVRAARERSRASAASS